MGNVKIEIENPPKNSTFADLSMGALFICPSERNGKVFRKLPRDDGNAENVITVYGCTFRDDALCQQIEITGFKVKLL